MENGRICLGFAQGTLLPCNRRVRGKVVIGWLSSLGVYWNHLGSLKIYPVALSHLYDSALIGLLHSLGIRILNKPSQMILMCKVSTELETGMLMLCFL